MLLTSSQNVFPLIQKSDEEIREEVMNRFERLGLKDRIATASYLEGRYRSDVTVDEYLCR